MTSPPFTEVKYRGQVFRQEPERPPVANEAKSQPVAPAPQLAVVTLPARRVRELETVEAQPKPVPKTMAGSRPQRMTEIVGQHELVEQLRIVCAGAKLRGTPMPHVLLTGASGLGKTTMAGLIAHELRGPLVKTSGPILQHVEDLVGVLCSLEPGSTLFVDECHRASTAALETLYEVMEDGKVSTLLGSGQSTRAHTFSIERLTVVAATTSPGSLAAPFKNRFGMRAAMAPYSESELATIVERAWVRFGVAGASGEALEVSRRSLGIPRLSLHLGERVLDVAAIEGYTDTVPSGLAARALSAFGVDSHGLTRSHWIVLDALCNKFHGRAVGIDSLASAVDMDRDTLANEIEPPLIQANLIERSARGRVALLAAFALFRKEA